MDRFCGLTWSSVVSPRVLCLSSSTGQVLGSGDSVEMSHSSEGVFHARSCLVESA